MSFWINWGDFHLQKDSLGNFTSVRVYLSKSESILRLQKDILGNFTSLQVDPGKSELIRPRLVRVRVVQSNFGTCLKQCHDVVSLE